MVINEKNETNRVKFIAYNGAYPNLCSGVLKLEIEGHLYVFGPKWKATEEEKRELHPEFWSPGGSCGFAGNNHTSSYCDQGEWTIDAEQLPEELQSYVAEIDRVFNENVEHGCCGGCL